MFYGQCSELCGRNHAFMPIAVHVVSEEEFADWLAKQKSSASGDETGKVATAEK
jgi:cytochrome c oxidase subunit 2